MENEMIVVKKSFKEGLNGVMKKVNLKKVLLITGAIGGLILGAAYLGNKQTDEDESDDNIIDASEEFGSDDDSDEPDAE